MTKLRTHYLTYGGARCGNPLQRNWTVDPKQVTCKSCQRFLSEKVK